MGCERGSGSFCVFEAANAQNGCSENGNLCDLLKDYGLSDAVSADTEQMSSVVGTCGISVHGSDLTPISPRS